MKSDTFERVYVDVKAAFNAAGKLMPLEIDLPPNPCTSPRVS